MAQTVTPTATLSPAFEQAFESNVMRPACFAGVAVEASFVPDAAQRLVLEQMRWLAIRARLRAREDMDRACYLLAGREETSFERCGLLFFSALHHHSRRKLTMHRPAAASLTRDEVWLLRLMEAARGPDTALFAQMVAWHVVPQAQRWVRFFGRELARCSTVV